MSIQDEVDQLRGRFRSLAERDQAEIPGAYELAAGLAKVVTHLRVGDIDDQQHLAVIVQGLRGLADFLDSNAEAEDAVIDDEPEEASDGEGLEQFIATFKNDAGNRIQGLSISLMGIFGEVGSEEALEQSTDHLHAIRGGAAMLGLDGIAALSSEMEEVLNTGQKLEPEQRHWPTKTLLRAYALLEEAIEAQPPAVDTEKTEPIIDELRHIHAEQKRQISPTSGSAQDVDSQTASQPSLGPSEETPPQKPSPGDSRSQPDLEQPILIVDDVETIAASVGFVLSELEVPIEVAANGEEAMQKLEHKAFSLVISDVDMPRMDGIALTRMIRSTEGIDDLPVILLTSLDHPDQRKKGMEAGATDYIIKGAIGGGELLNRVKELLAVAPVVERDDSARKRHILVAEDTETVAASIAFVLSEGPFEIILATDGKDARRKLKQHDFDLLITDLQMPYVNGTELVESVRDHDRFEDLPIIMLTSVEDEDEMAQAVEAGVDRYVIKGEIAGGRLLEEVEQLLDAPS